MVRALRRKHRQAWSVLALLLPLGILLAWLAIPSQPVIQLLDDKMDEPLPLIVKTADQKDYRVNIRCSVDSLHWQLEWNNKTVLMVPSAVIYHLSTEHPFQEDSASFNPASAELVGRIEAKEDYRFVLKERPEKGRACILILYDFIHEKVIDRVRL